MHICLGEELSNLFQHGAVNHDIEGENSASGEHAVVPPVSVNKATILQSWILLK